MPSVNLKYATNGYGFFTNVDAIKTIITKHKQENAIATFNEIDDNEIKRGGSYAAFPELCDMVENDKKVTVTSFRKSLAQREVNDLAMQNKVLNLVLQNKAGVQYAMGTVISGLFLERNFTLIMKVSRYPIALEVNGANSVDLIFTGQWENYNETPREPSITAKVKINITPNDASITDFTLEKMGDSEVANSAFKFLQNNQQNILMQLITYIKHALGFNSELIIEKSSENDLDWANPPKM